MISIISGHSGGILMHKTGVNTQRHKCIIHFLTGGVRAHGSGSAERAPGKAQRSGFDGKEDERRNGRASSGFPTKCALLGKRTSSGATELSEPAREANGCEACEDDVTEAMEMEPARTKPAGARTEAEQKEREAERADMGQPFFPGAERHRVPGKARFGGARTSGGM